MFKKKKKKSKCQFFCDHWASVTVFDVHPSDEVICYTSNLKNYLMNYDSVLKEHSFQLFYDIYGK